MAKPVGSQSVKVTQAEASSGARELYDLWRARAT
jgi:hypothetical protein